MLFKTLPLQKNISVPGTESGTLWPDYKMFYATDGQKVNSQKFDLSVIESKVLKKKSFSNNQRFGSLRKQIVKYKVKVYCLNLPLNNFNFQIRSHGALGIILIRKTTTKLKKFKNCRENKKLKLKNVCAVFRIFDVPE